VEIEAKFVLPSAEALEQLQQLTALGAYELGQAAPQSITDRYMDTPERTILAGGYVCRLRRTEKGEYITLKGLEEAEGPIHRRFEDEIELPAEADAYQPKSWPPSEAKELVVTLSQGAPLELLFELHQVRTSRPVWQEGQPVAEWSLDQVELAAGEADQAWLELELELLPDGSEDDLAALVGELKDGWDLVPEPRSKFERALAMVSPPTPAPEEPPRLLTLEQRELVERIARRDDLYGRRATALLALDEGARQVDAGERAQMSARRVRHWLREFRHRGLGIFPERVRRQAAPPPPEPPPVPPEPLSLDQLLARYDVNQPHARAVAEHALTLFDLATGVHHLPPRWRGLLEAAALLHNIGFRIDPRRHHIAGREILQAHPPLELDTTQRQVVAATTYLHRRPISAKRLRKLKAHACLAALPAEVRDQTLILAALIRMAAGLDFSQDQTSRLGRAAVGSGEVSLEVVGPHAEVDAKRAQEKADLWDLLFDTPIRFWVSGVLISAQPISALPQQPGIEPDDPMTEAGRKVLWFHFQRMVAHEPGTRLGEDIEELHDMRVATRRMRASFRVFGDYFDAETMRPFLKGLKRTGRALGPVRDLDVFRVKVQTYLDTLPPERQGELDPLLAVCEQQRSAARERMLSYLDGKAYARFKDRLGDLLQTPEGTGRPTREAGGDPIPHRVRHVAPVTVFERLAAVRAYDEWVSVPHPALDRLHALRIAFKRFRYTLEFFEEVLGPEANDVIKEVKSMQDHLGDLQDAVVASGLLRDFLTWGTWGRAKRSEDAPSVPVIAPGVAAYLAVKQAELQNLLDTFPPAWEAFRGVGFSQLVAAAISVL
jgi:CHAD domain-containing protein